MTEIKNSITKKYDIRNSAYFINIFHTEYSEIHLKAANKHINTYFAKMRHSVNAGRDEFIN